MDSKRVPPQPRTLYLRPEARPFSFPLLTDSQKRAFQSLVWLLEDGLNQLDLAEKDAKREKPALPLRLRPQSQRVNPAIMISGARGTGKTSLLLTLQQVMSPNSSLEGHQPDLRYLEQRIVWLETLDLEPLPKTAGLMGAILARIKQAIDEDMELGSDSLQRPQSEFMRAQQELDELSLQACLAWDHGNLGQISGMDISQHAREIVGVETALATMHARFATLLDKLAKLTPWKGEKRNPLFVLPVDDLDLNPSRCLDLLRLTRSFRSQRLVLILLGDFDIARNIVNLNYLNELGSLLPDHIAGADGVRRHIVSQAITLGAEATRKLLPPSQCFWLDNVSLEEALAFDLRHLDVTSPHEGTSLGYLLKQIPLVLSRAGAPSTLLELIQGNERWRQLAEHPNQLGFEIAPIAASAIRTTLRKLTDLWICLEEFLQLSETKRLGKVVEMLWQEFQRALRETGETRASQTMPHFAPGARISNEPFQLRFRTTAQDEFRCSFPKASQVTLKTVDRLELQLPAAFHGETSDLLVGSAVLLHDVLKLSNSAAAIPLDVPQVSSLEFVRIDWRLVSGGSKCSVVWPAPTLQTAWELELFVRYWSSIRSRLQLPSNTVSRENFSAAALLWLALGGAFVFDSERLWQLVHQENEPILVNDVYHLANAVIEEYDAQIRKRANSLAMHPLVNLQLESPGVLEWLTKVATIFAFECYNPLASLVVDPKLNLAIQFNWDFSILIQEEQFEAVRNMRLQSITNPNALLSHALLNPMGFLDVVKVLLRRVENAIDALKSLAGPSPEFPVERAFVDRQASLRALNTLAKIVDQALEVSFDPTDSEVTSQKKQRSNVVSSRYHELFAQCRDRFRELRNKVNPRSEFAESIRKDLNESQQSLACIEESLAVWELSVRHPLNTFHGGALCPEMPVEEVTL